VPAVERDNSRTPRSLLRETDGPVHDAVDAASQLPTESCRWTSCPKSAPPMAMSVLAGEQKRRAIPAWSMAAGIAILFLGMVGYAKATGQWDTNLPKHFYLQLVPNAKQQHRPMPGAQ